MYVILTCIFGIELFHTIFIRHTSYFFSFLNIFYNGWNMADKENAAQGRFEGSAVTADIEGASPSVPIFISPVLCRRDT